MAQIAVPNWTSSGPKSLTIPSAHELSMNKLLVLLIVTESGNLPRVLPILYSFDSFWMLDLYVGRNHVERRSFGVSSGRLEELNGREVMEQAQELYCDRTFQFVEKHYNSAARPQMPEPESKLRGCQSASLSVLSVVCARLGAEYLSIAEDEVELAIFMKVFGEEVGEIRVSLSDVVDTQV
jgi:hypothetical protein